LHALGRRARDCVADRRHDSLGGVTVDLTDNLARDPLPLGAQPRGAVERPLDSGDELREVGSAIERFRLQQLPVVLARQIEVGPTPPSGALRRTSRIRKAGR
jgi:hypothetical protein